MKKKSAPIYPNNFFSKYPTNELKQLQDIKMIVYGKKHKAVRGAGGGLSM